MCVILIHEHCQQHWPSSCLFGLHSLCVIHDFLSITGSINLILVHFRLTEWVCNSDPSPLTTTFKLAFCDLQEVRNFDSWALRRSVDILVHLWQTAGAQSWFMSSTSSINLIFVDCWLAGCVSFLFLSTVTSIDPILVHFRLTAGTYFWLIAALSSYISHPQLCDTRASQETLTSFLTHSRCVHPDHRRHRWSHSESCTFPTCRDVCTSQLSMSPIWLTSFVSTHSG